MDAGTGDARPSTFQNLMAFWTGHEFTMTTATMVVIVAGQIVSYIFRDAVIVKVDWPLL